jgi:CDP-diacylglycerol--serine O-phosphatidyltransferase
LKAIIKNIPNTITAGNLFCGCLAILSIAQGNLVSASWFVITAAVLDFLDGFIARLLKVNSEIGKQLDSLADIVTFGVVPGYTLYTLLTQTQFCENGTCWKALVLPYYGFLITIFSAVRLAKFNIDTRQTNSFIGVPTPANALMIASFSLTPITSFMYPVIHHYVFLAGVCLIMSYLLVAEIPLFALKFKSFGWKGNQPRFIFLLSSLLLLLMLGPSAAIFILLLYVIMSLIFEKFNIYKKSQNTVL